MAITQQTAIKVWVAAGGMCAFEGCREHLLIHDTNALVGNIAHIIAQRANGPRGNASVSRQQLDSYENLILLCPTHHLQVDKDPVTWTVEALTKMKVSHEEWVKSRLIAGSPWKSNLSQLEYVNLPRLAILAGIHGYRLDLSYLDPQRDLHSMGMELNAILVSIGSLLQQLDLHAVPLSNIRDFDKGLEGMTLSFEASFRTKNVPDMEYRQSGKPLYIGDPDRGPQVYRKQGEWKILLAIDPQWITTTTAYVDFRSGIHKFAGLGTIKEVAPAKRLVRATPLVIGLPKNPLNDLFG